MESMLRKEIKEKSVKNGGGKRIGKERDITYRDTVSGPSAKAFCGHGVQIQV